MYDPAAFDPPPGIMMQVAPGVRRLLAPNPSPMTYRGTNTYVVGQGRVAVIDPGPDDLRHLAALEAGLAGEVISHILVTHAHLDHSPMARVLAARCGAPVLAFGAAAAGRSALMRRLVRTGGLGGGEGVDAAFRPDLCLPDGAVIDGAGWRLTAHHTPGHMANHLCFALGDTVFSGDHVMGWSTSLVSPPDGDLGAFMASCAGLRTLAPARLLAGHGAPVDDAVSRIDALIAHRTARSAQIIAALSDTPQSIGCITTQVYADLTPPLIPAARRNVFAHLIDLVSKSQAQAMPDLSQSAHFKRWADL